VSTETRMAIHVAALKADWERPGSYREFTRRALERGQTSAPSPTISALSNRPAGAGENCRPEQIPTLRVFAKTVATERSARPMRGRGCRINIAAKSRPAHSLRERLEVVARAWDEFQRSCSRDAIYPFLQRVFSLVERYEQRGRVKRLMRDILKQTGLRAADADTNIYALIIRVAAASDGVDRKQSSKLSRVLRFAAEFKPKRVSLRAFIQARGGLNEVAALYARHLGRQRRG
jgi:hypothetical protein